MIKSAIIDGCSSNRAALVDEDRGVLVSINPQPVFGRETKVRILRQYLTDDGEADGDTDMRVDGSATNQDFFIPAHATRDRYITTLSFVIADASATLSEFGNLNIALTNGCQLFYSDDHGTVDIHDALKTNFDFVRLCGGNPAFGDGAGAFRGGNVISTSEGYIPVLDLRQQFGLQWGIRLGARS